MIWQPTNVFLDWGYCNQWPYLFVWCTTRGLAFLRAAYSIFGPQDFKNWADRRGIPHKRRDILRYNVWLYVYQQEPSWSTYHTFIINRTWYRGGLWITFKGMWWTPGWPQHSAPFSADIPAPAYYPLLDSETWTAAPP